MKNTISIAEFKKLRKEGRVGVVKIIGFTTPEISVNGDSLVTIAGIPALSVNDAWKGQRFKTDTYKAYEKKLLLFLPKIKLPSPPYKISFTFGLSNMASDWDNPVKPFQDILQKKYGFNDKDIMEASVKKKIVNKGSEFIEFAITSLYSQNHVEDGI